MPELKLRLRGDPKPKGSMRAFLPRGSTRPIVTNANPNTKEWEQLVRYAAQSDTGDWRLPNRDVPVSVAIEFVIRRPKANKRGGYSTKKPDIDKLARAVLDGLTGIGYLDDAQVSTLHVTKRYTVDDEWPGAHIHLRLLAPFVPAKA